MKTKTDSDQMPQVEGNDLKPGDYVVSSLLPLEGWILKLEDCPQPIDYDKDGCRHCSKKIANLLMLDDGFRVTGSGWCVGSPKLFRKVKNGRRKKTG